MNHGYMGFSKVDENSNFVACEGKKKNQRLNIMKPVKLKVVQWLKLHTSNAQGVGLIPGQGTKIPHAMWHGQ